MDIYKIVSTSSGQVVAVSDASHDSGARLIQYPYKGDGSQQWQLVSIDGDRCKIVSVSSGKVMAVAGASHDSGARLIQYPYTGDGSQQWQVVLIEGDYFKIVSVLSGQVMAVASASKDQAAPLIQYPYSGDDSQQWQIVWVDESRSLCKIVSLLSGQVMAVAGASHNSGARLIQYPYKGDKSQQWQLVPIDGCRYKIVSVLSGQVMAVASASKDRAAPLIQYPYSDDSSQQWVLAPIQLSKIVSVETSQVVAVASASKEVGAQLIQYPYSGNSSQQWELIKLSVDPLTEKEIKEAIARFGPILKFHPRERYLMCSVEWFLEHSQLHDDKTGKVISKPTVAQLPTGSKENGRYWLTLDGSAKGGDLSTARAYVRAYAPLNQDYTDLQFYFFYAYNGPGTLHLFTLLSTGNADLKPLGEHFGDWETCVLRIDNATRSLLGVWLSQHDSGQWFEGAQLEKFSRHNEQIIVYSSFNGHANYLSVGQNPTHEGDYGVVSWFLRNDTDEGGRSLDCAVRYDLVSALSVTEPRWLDYPYRWGPEHTHTEITQEQAYQIVRVALGKLSALVPEDIAGPVVAQIITSFKTDDLNGPEGPKQKDAWLGKYD